MNIADLLAKYDRRVPRYTSYPTAPHFSPAITGAHYAGWLAALPDETPLSLYLHVPFCAALCLFCACHTTVVHRPEPLIAYGTTLQTEIANVADAIRRPLPVRHIHWGGGTPTALPPVVMRDVMTSLRTHFDVQPDAEIAVEVDPRTLSDDSVQALGEMGVTRASLGVQDFDTTVQEAIHRLQDYALTAGCAERLRKVGVRSINLDLIYGLPYQTVPGVAQTVQQALQIAPDRVAVFGYAHVPWMKKHQALLPEHALPDAPQRFAQRAVVEQVLTTAGYTAIGLDHFARPGEALATAAAHARLKRNFQGYTTDDAPVLVGLGASSIGSMPQGYVQNNPSVPAWRDAVRAGTLPITRGIALTAEDRLRRAVIETLMCTNAVDLRAVAAQHRADPATLMNAAPALQSLARDGLVQWDGMRVTLTPEGRPFVRAVAAAFDTYLAAGNARHSAAV
ncbi:MAG TPA: oxygen-independent coproporphyrinogen III oxidase [Acetobacteraceae bacterium]|nr:oxygen-independent coproporphyrinogen III oxidase [Acetobacteraceae bacterium]